MKKLIVLIFSATIFFACTTSRVQLPEGGTVPQKVLNNFNNLHEGSTNQEWTVLPNDQYSVRYRITGFRFRDVLDANGQLVHTQQEVRQATLPEAINSLIFREYANYQMGEASKVTFPDGEQVWDVALEGPENAHFVLRIRRDGTVISQTEAEDYRWFM